MPPPVMPYRSAESGPNLALIASRQRGVILCILAYIVCVVLQLAMPRDVPFAVLLPAAIGLAAAITGAVFVFMLAQTIYSTGVGILMGILTLIPLIGLIVLLIINGRATKILKQNGIPVGFLGATVPPGR